MTYRCDNTDCQNAYAIDPLFLRIKEVDLLDKRGRVIEKTAHKEGDKIRCAYCFHLAEAQPPAAS